MIKEEKTTIPLYKKLGQLAQKGGHLTRWRKRKNHIDALSQRQFNDRDIEFMDFMPYLRMINDGMLAWLEQTLWFF